MNQVLGISSWLSKRIKALLAVGLLLPSLWVHASQPSLPQHVQTVEGIQEYRLDNGLQILLVPDSSKPTTTVNITYRVGSRHENYGQTGMAHLLEHLLFKGTPRHPKVWSDFNQRGLQANGSTWFDRTNYFASFSANDANLKWYMDWLADGMRNSFIARKDLDTEMTVVRNEMEMGENNPSRILFSKTLSAMYQWHNYGKSTIGARADVEGVDIAQLKAFYLQHYRPDNATLIVSGKFDQKQVLKWVAQYFGAIKVKQDKPLQQYTLDPVQDGERSVVLRRVGGVPLLYAAYHVMPGADPDFAAIELLSLILGDEPSGRLHKQLTEKQLAASVFGFSQALADPGFMMLGAQMGPGQDPDKAAQALTEAIESFAATPIQADELARAKSKWLKAWDQGFADPEQIGVDLSEAVAQGDWRLYFATRDRVRDIALPDVQRVAEQVFKRSNRTLGQYVPTANPERTAAPARVDLATVMASFKPKQGTDQVEAFDASPSNIDKLTSHASPLPDMQVALLPKSTRGDTVNASLVMRFGDVDSLKGWGQVPDAMAALLDKGAAGMSRQQIQDRLDTLQAEVSVSAGVDALHIGIQAKRDTLPQVIALIGQMLRQPVFPQDVLNEVKQSALSSLEAQRKEPQALLGNVLAKYADPYPAGDVRHVASFDELAQQWQDVSIERIRDFHQRFINAGRVDFSAVGAFDEKEVSAALAKSFDKWPATVNYTRVANPWHALKPWRTEIKTPDKQNAVMSVMLPLPLNDKDPDYAALMMANYLFGSGGDSRLWNRIREKEGLSYSVYSSVQWNTWEPHSRWVVQAIFAPQNKAKVEQAFSEELSRAVTEGFSQKELSVGKEGLLNFRRLSRAQDDRLATAWIGFLEQNRTFQDSARVDQALTNLTLEQVNAAFKKYIQADQLVIGFAGDFKP